MSTTHRTRGTGPRRVRCCIGGALVAALAVAGGFAVENAQVQERTRLNNVIEAIEQGRPAIANQDWCFVDMERSPFSAGGIVEAFAEAEQVHE